MPLMHQVIHFANRAFEPESVEDFPMSVLDDLGPAATFADAINALGFTTRAADLAFINRWPKGQLAAVSAAIRACLAQDPRMPITFAWAPAYDYEITIWESAGVAVSPAGEMTILFKSRYPGDVNPVLLDGGDAPVA